MHLPVSYTTLHHTLQHTAQRLPFCTFWVSEPGLNTLHICRPQTHFCSSRRLTFAAFHTLHTMPHRFAGYILLKK